MDLKKKIVIFSLSILAIFAAGVYTGTQDFVLKVVQTEKTKSKEDIKIVERIVEKPGGERIIYRTRTEKREDTAKKKVVTVKKDKKWLVGLSRSVYGYSSPGPTHTISIYKKTLPGLYVGAWGSSDSEYGLGLIYSF